VCPEIAPAPGAQRHLAPAAAGLGCAFERIPSEIETSEKTGIAFIIVINDSVTTECAGEYLAAVNST